MGDPEGRQFFVHMNMEEMRVLASFINDKGRVSMSELTTEVNRVLQLSALQGGDDSGVKATVEDAEEGVPDRDSQSQGQQGAADQSEH